MRQFLLPRGLCGLLLLCGFCSARPCVAQNDDSVPPLSGDVVAIIAPRTNMEIPERFAKVVQLSKRILRVDGFDPSVVSVTALSPQQLRISAIEQGVTTVVITNEDAETFTLEVFVTGDARLLQAVLNRMYPNTSVTATKIRDSVLLRGWVTEPQEISDIVAVAETYHPQVLNQMRVAGPQEVQLRVKVMEVQRSLTRRMGINWTYFNDNAAIISVPGPIAGLGALATPLGGSPTGNLNASGFQNASMAFGFADANNTFLALIDALKQEGLLKLHAETTLVTRNGEPAKLENGGEFPIPVPQSLGTVTIQWREFGVILTSLPIITSPTRLKQQVSIEVSERDTTTAVTLNGTTVPGLNKRRVQTQAEMNFGDTMVIGGLIFTRYTADTNKIPFLGELPGIGMAFRRERFNEAETELVVMITPEIGAPLSSDQVPPGGPGMFTDNPTDREFYWQGLVEVPQYGGTSRCPNGDCYGNGTPGMMPASNLMPSPDMNYSPAPGTMPPPPMVPSSNPAPTEPSLISPPGLQAPPPPGADPSVSQRKKKTVWPTTSSSQQVSQTRKLNSPSPQNSGVQQTGHQHGYRRPSTVDRAAHQQQKMISTPNMIRTPQ